MRGQHALPAWLCACGRCLVDMCQDPGIMHVLHNQHALPGTSIGGEVLPGPCQEQWACWEAQHGSSS